MSTTKLRDQQYYESMKSKHLGLGNADTTRDEWITNVKRDTYGSMAGHSFLTEYYGVAVGLPNQLAKQKLLEQMIEPLKK